VLLETTVENVSLSNCAIVRSQISCSESRILEAEPLAAQIKTTDETLIVDLVDGRSLVVPLSWYPRLLHASQEERQN
jgi:hypothetical protein